MKKMIFILAMVFFAASVSAQPLQDFQYDSTLSIDQDGAFSVTGGETVEANVSFDSIVSRELPLVVKLKLSSDSMKVVGEEFNLDVTSYSSNSDTSRTTNLSCSSTQVSRNVSVWKCLNSSTDEIISSSQNTVNVEATAVKNIKPGKYDYELKLLSEVGVGGSTVNKTVNASETATVNTSNNETIVKVNPGADANVTVKHLTQVSDPNPSANDFVGGVSVDVSNSSGEVEASGVVTISYPESFDNRDVDVFFYNDTGDTNEWVNVGETQYPSNNTVSAEVSHFSTYGAFVQEENSNPDSSDGGSIPVESYTEGDQQEDETLGNQKTADTGNKRQEEFDQKNKEETRQQENEETGKSEESGQIEGENAQKKLKTHQTPAGQFYSQPGNLILSLLFLIAASVAVLQYSGRIDLRSYVPYSF